MIFMRRFCRIIKRAEAGAGIFAAVLALSACGTAKPSVSGESVGNPSSSASSEPSEETADMSSVPAAASSAPAVTPTPAPEVLTIGVETGTAVDFLYDDEIDRLTASMQYPVMRLSGEDQNNYPELQKSLEELMSERADRARGIYDEAVDAAGKTPLPDRSPAYYVTENARVRRADSQVLSIALDGGWCTDYTQENPYIQGVVFDSGTGQRLNLSDAVGDMSLLAKAAAEQLNATADQDGSVSEADIRQYLEENGDDVSWAVDYYGLTIFFNPGDLASGNDDVVSVTIPFEAYPDLIAQEYTQMPDSRATEFPKDYPFVCDVNGDGASDTLTVTGTVESSFGAEYYIGLSIDLNGNTYSEECSVSSIDPVLIRTGDGTVYLYVFMQQEDDEYFEIFDLSGGTAALAGTVESGMHNTGNPDEWDEYRFRENLTDPDNFQLDTVTQVLGTATGYDTYQAGPDGIPKGENGWLVIARTIEYTVRTDFPVSLVDESGNEAGSGQLSSGETVTYYRTDGESWADLKTADGTIARVSVQNDDGFCRVNGTDADAVFDGIIFAG